MFLGPESIIYRDVAFNTNDQPVMNTEFYEMCSKAGLITGIFLCLCGVAFFVLLRLGVSYDAFDSFSLKPSHKVIPSLAASLKLSLSIMISGGLLIFFSISAKALGKEMDHAYSEGKKFFSKF
ncbi:MAG: hypothetical protein EOP85_06795 [Verrucomicrobiaceae bacterium]|nr:MAG: hypothetical protein EOP85_06795 [Verrucomicrobiaceae bacterium]